LGVIIISRGCFERCCSNKKLSHTLIHLAISHRLSCAGAAVGVSAVLSLIAHIVLRIDDRAIGTAECALSQCLDQNWHELNLPLRPFAKEHKTFFVRGGGAGADEEPHAQRNAAGALGTLRVALAYTEL